MTIAIIIYFLVALVAIRKLLLFGMRPSKTLGWLLAIFTIPVVGILFYLVLGRNRRKDKFYKLKKTKTISQYLNKVDEYYNSLGRNEDNETPPAIEEHVKLVKLITKNSKFLPSLGNDLTPLKNGPSTFEAIFDAMETAKKFIHIQYYIFEDGQLARKFLSILQQKAKEGVAIRFMYDGLGSSSLSKKYMGRLRDAGVEVYGFLPMRFGRLLSSINYRNHRKIVIVDGVTAFTGGINVSDKYIKGDPNLGVWHDMHLQVQGPIVNNLQAVFAMDWNFASAVQSGIRDYVFPPCCAGIPQYRR